MGDSHPPAAFLLPGRNQWGLKLLRVELEFVDAQGRQAKVAGWMLHARGRAIAKQTLQRRGLKDRVTAAHFERRAGRSGDGVAAKVFFFELGG